MISVSGKFADKRRYPVLGIGIAILVVASFVFILFMILDNGSEQDITKMAASKVALIGLSSLAFFLFPFIGIFMLSKKDKTKGKPVMLSLVSDGVSMSLERNNNGIIRILYQNLKWHELSVIEHKIRERFETDYEPAVFRQLQLRLWNENGQVLLIEKIENQVLDGIQVWGARDVPPADYASIEPGTLQRMADLAKECGLYND